MKKLKNYIALIMASLCLCGCGVSERSISAGTASDTEPKGKVYFTYFDTVSYIYSYAGDDMSRFDENCADVSSLLSDYNMLFDIYHEYSDMNNLRTLNLNAGGEAIELDPRLIEFLEYTKEIYTITDGYTNVMMGSVLSLWHDCREAASDDPANASIPDDETLKKAGEHIDIDLLEIDSENNTARIADPDASIDVGAVGKGYATEKAAQLLEENGVTSYVLNIGGNIRIIGTKPDGSSWTAGIKDPKDPDNSFFTRINIADTSCVTSGVYERYFKVGGKKYHHIIDVDTLYPAENYASISIVTKDSGLADSLSTALFCMDYEKGAELVGTMPEVEVLWIMDDGSMNCTDGFKNLMAEN